MNTRPMVVLLLIVVLALASIGAVNAQDSATNIALNGDSISVTGDGATADGSIVTISAAGTFNLTGTLTDGQILVDSEDAGAVTLVLNGVNLTSSTSAPIYVKNAESVALVSADGTENTVTDAAEYVYASADEDEPDAAVFSDVDMIIDGSGSLTVQANYGDGIVSKDALTITGEPVITVNSVDDSIRGKDSLTISGGTFTLTSAEGDGLKSNNDDADVELGNIHITGGTFTITAADDGLQSVTTTTIDGGDFTISAGGDGIHSDWHLIINDGDIHVLTSEEGLEAGFITINDGSIRLLATDDGINVSEPDDIPNPSLYLLAINGGTIVVEAAGDGLDSNGSIEMTGGLVIVNGPISNMDGALDYDGTFTISGGELIAAGSAGMPYAPNDTSAQNSVLIVFDSLQTAGTLVHIAAADGTPLLTFAPSKDFQSLVYSAPELATGDTYDVYLGGTSDGTVTDGLYADGTYTPGTLQASFTVDSPETQVGDVRGPGGRGGGPGGPGGQPGGPGGQPGGPGGQPGSQG